MRSLNFNRQQLRHTACVALLASLFALVSGVANACLLQAAEPGAAALSLSVSTRTGGCDSGAEPCERDARPAYHHADSERGEPSEHGRNAVCLKFCGDESSALAKSKASLADLPGPVLLAGAPWSPAEQVAAAAQWQAVERQVSVGPALFVRLLRLTI